MKHLISALFTTLTFLVSIGFAQLTPDLRPQQEYLFDPSNTGTGVIGVGAWNVWSIPGAKGDGIKMVDIETQGWHLGHEDLPSGITRIFGDANSHNHGTAVLGILVGKENNNMGITGICPNATVKVATGEDENVRVVDLAIQAARNALDAGDIIILETQWSRQGMFLPEEDKLDSYNQIVAAINDSIIVIEAGGNGNVNLDNALTRPESGAIIVGAGKKDALERVSTSNFGNRVHVHAWGEAVVTAGYGDLEDGGTPGPNDDYTGIFSNTSSATAIVAGVVASLQGIYFAATGQELGPKKMRKILVDSGLPQSGNPVKPIGPRVNLPEAVAEINSRFGLNLGNFITVTGDQTDAGNTSFDNISHYKLDQFIQHPVPHEFYFLENSSQVLKALQSFKSGTTEKYNDWNDQDVLNHRSFFIDANTSTALARFKTAHNASIQTELISAGGTLNEGYVEFADPWYFEEDPQSPYYDPPYSYKNLGMAAPLIPYNSLPLQLLTNSDFKGVFLDQGWPNWQPPYYTVAAPQQEIDEITYFLEEWIGENSSAEFENAYAGTTAVIFRQPNAVVNAKMKGHLVSNTPAATAYNNGRRVAQDIFGHFHCVYEDNGHIYYIKSTDNGQTWSNEVRLSSPGTVNKQPLYRFSPGSFVKSLFPIYPECGLEL